MDTALEIAQRAADELGVPRPSSLAGSANQMSRQFLALLNSGGRELVRAHAWGDLITSYSFSTEVGEDTYAVPADFQRLVSETSWDRTSHLRVTGPTTPQLDRFRRDGIAATAAARYVFRQIGRTAISLFPVPTAVTTVGYEYVSMYWARSGVAKIEITADTDTTIFDPDLMVKDLKFRFLSAKSMDTTIAVAERNAMLMQLIAADIGGSTLNMGPRTECDEGEVFAGTEPNIILSEGGDFIEYD